MEREYVMHSNRHEAKSYESSCERNCSGASNHHASSSAAGSWGSAMLDDRSILSEKGMRRKMKEMRNDHDQFNLMRY